MALLTAVNGQMPSSVNAQPTIKSITVGAQTAVQVDVLPLIPMDSSNVSQYVSPVAYRNKEIYTTNVEPGNGSGVPDVNLQTVIRKCSIRTDTSCIWESKVIDDATLKDMYHTQPSVALDRAGFVHVAYNMHNMPWQYAVSKTPQDITAFEFRGDTVSLLERSTVKLLNKTPFPSIGTAAIPGNQVTYPAFFHDRNGDLFITYRYATRPKLSFGERSFAGAIAAYDVNTQKWKSLGGDVTISSTDADLPGNTTFAVTKPFALTDGWQPQPIRLFFDRKNRMHVAWVWREHKSGFEYINASYAFSDDLGLSFKDSKAKLYTMPIKMSDAERPFAGYLASQVLSMAIVSIAADAVGQPYFVSAPVGQNCLLTFFNQKTNAWELPEPMPFNAVRFEIDEDGRQWVFTTGLKILRREGNSKKWMTIWEDSDALKYGWPTILAVPNERMFIVHTMNADINKVKIYVVKY